MERIERFIKTFVLLTVIMFLPLACYIFERCPEVPPYFRINSLQISSIRMTGDYRNPVINIPDKGQSKWGDYAIRVNFLTTYYSYKKTKGYTLYALSCNENGYKGSQVGIDTLYVITLFDYNDNFLANDTINQIVSINDKDYHPQNSEYFDSIEIYTFENKEKIYGQFFYAKIDTYPSVNTDFSQFKIVYILKDGTRLEGVTDQIKLTL